MLLEPGFDFVVGGAGGDELFKFFNADSGAGEKASVHGAAVNEFALQADEGGTAFVDAARGFFEAGEFFRWAAWLLAAQVPGEFFDGFQIFHSISRSQGSTLLRKAV
jgi:hypothetical protein